MAAASSFLEAPAATPASPAATPAVTGQGGTATPAPGFDAILMLQNLAATGETLDAASLDAGDTADLLGSDDSEDDGDDDLDASLAFLSALISATTPKSGNDSPGDFQSGAQAQGESGDELAPGIKPVSGDASGFALGLLGDGKSVSDPGEAALGLTALRPEVLDHRTHTGDASQNLARAAELLAQAQRPAAATEPAAIATHARDPRWADDFGARVSLMVRAGESTASLQLTPVDLGPVEVNVTVKDSQATIHFGATHADTRALIEASLPRLRELLASQGFNLLDASVSSGFSRSQQQAFASGNRHGSDSESASVEAVTSRPLGLLDLYA